jgi:hypothetical protein
MVERAGRQAKLAFKAHPHVLRRRLPLCLGHKGHDSAPCEPTSATETFSILSRTPSYRAVKTSLTRQLANE